MEELGKTLRIVPNGRSLRHFLLPWQLPEQITSTLTFGCPPLLVQVPPSSRF
jgi:hypothetical protein